MSKSLDTSDSNLTSQLPRSLKPYDATVVAACDTVCRTRRYGDRNVRGRDLAWRILVCALATGCGAPPLAPLDAPADVGTDATRPDVREAPDAQDGGVCVALRDDGCPEAFPTGWIQANCDYGCRPATLGLSCTYPTTHCECAVGAGLYWRCDPIQCIAARPVVGAPCRSSGLVCGAGFENEGMICAPGAGVWVTCLDVRYPGTGSGNALQCPSAAPNTGTPCCVINHYGGDASCHYPSEDGGTQRFECVGYQWTPLAP